MKSERPDERRAAIYSLDKPERVSVEAGPIVGEENRVAGVGGVVFYAGGLAGSYAGKVESLFEAGDVLGGFIGYAGDCVRVIKKAERETGFDRDFGHGRGRWFGSGRWHGLPRVLHNLQDLSFNDAADAIQIGTALAFNCGVVKWFATQPEKHPYGRENYQSRQGNQVLPIGEKVFQRRYLSADGGLYKASRGRVV
jgi:hypothetical protein